MNRSHSTTFNYSCKHFSLTERKEIASALFRGFSIRPSLELLAELPAPCLEKLNVTLQMYQISNIQNWINDYPRKKFRFKTAQQMFNIELKKHSLTVA